MLLIAASRILAAREGINLITPLFDDFPGHCAVAFGEFGEEGELRLLERNLDSLEGGQKKEARRAIRLIEKRNKRKR